jgi:hypothetical protein
VNGDAAPSQYQVKYLSKQLNWGRESIKDDHCLGRPVKTTTLEICQEIEDHVMLDRCLKVSTITQECNCFCHNNLGMMVNSHWVLRMLTPLWNHRFYFLQRILNFMKQMEKHFSQQL